MLSFALLAGCSSPSGPGAPVQPEPPAVLAEAAPDTFVRRTFKAGDSLADHGAYFLNSTSGEGEAWVYPTAEKYSWLGGRISDDNRLVSAGAEDRTYLIDRDAQVVWRLGESYGLLLVDPHGTLVAELKPKGDGQWERTGRLFWTDVQLKPLVSFTVEDAGGGIRALLSPDGTRLAVLHDAGASKGYVVSLVDLPSGKVEQRELPQQRVSLAALRQRENGFQAELWSQHPATGVAVRRFGWDGSVLGDHQMPNHLFAYSPDGQWVTWEERPLGNLAPVTVLADAATLAPKLQGVGVSICFAINSASGHRWLSDSSGLVVSTGEGYRILTVDGELKEPPAFVGLTWKDEPQPAPDHPDRFAIGRTQVVNSAGDRAVGITLDGYVTPTSLDPWGAASDEMRFILPPPAKGGACNEWPLMPPAVVKPGPLPAEPVVVQSRYGGVELRSLAHSAGELITRVANGTRLALVGDSAVEWSDGASWLHVRTPQGAVGWANLTDGPIAWVDDL